MAEPLPILRTERLTLRPPISADAAAIAVVLADFDVSKWLATVPHPYPPGAARAWIAQTTTAADEGEDASFIIALPDGTVCGKVGFHGLGFAPNLGFWLGQGWWGRGLMTEAVWAALGWFFARSRVADLQSCVFDGNDASLAIHRRTGFRELPRSTCYCLARGASVAETPFVLTRDAYLGARARAGAGS